MRVCVVFCFHSSCGLAVALRIENGSLIMDKSGHSDCLDRFSHSDENSGNPFYSHTKIVFTGALRSRALNFARCNHPFQIITRYWDLTGDAPNHKSAPLTGCWRSSIIPMLTPTPPPPSSAPRN